MEVRITTIDEEFEKAQVKGFTRTRKGKTERVSPFERRGRWVGFGRRAFKTWKKDGTNYRKHPVTGRVQAFSWPSGWSNVTETKAEKEKHAGKLAKRSSREREARKLAREAGYVYSMGKLRHPVFPGSSERMSIGEVIDKFKTKPEKGEKISSSSIADKIIKEISSDRGLIKQLREGSRQDRNEAAFDEVSTRMGKYKLSEDWKFDHEDAVHRKVLSWINKLPKLE